MKTIISVLESSVSKQDVANYYTFHRFFAGHGANPVSCTLYANIAFLLTTRTLVDKLLKHLEDDVSQLWQTTKETSNTQLKINHPQQYCEYFGLSWPMPSTALAGNHSNHLLSRALFSMEKRHGINTDSEGNATIPTFVGYIIDEDASNVLSHHQLWNEESKLSPLFFHGKMTHRIQFNLLLRAIELRWLDLGDLSLHQVMNMLIQGSLSHCKIYKPWEFLLDMVTVNVNLRKEVDMQHLTPLLQAYPPVTTNNHSPYIYACDPYFLNSYLMTVSRVNTPHLSECVTQCFAKSALALQKIERKVGTYAQLIDYFVTSPPANIKSQPLTEYDLTMSQVMRRQALTFAVAEIHQVTYKHILLEQAERGKGVSRIVTTKSGVIQYRSFFAPINKNCDPVEVNKKLKVQ